MNWKITMAIVTVINGVGAFGGLVMGMDIPLGLACAVLFGLCVVLDIYGFKTNWWSDD